MDGGGGWDSVREIRRVFVNFTGWCGHTPSAMVGSFLAVGDESTSLGGDEGQGCRASVDRNTSNSLSVKRTLTLLHQLACPFAMF